MAQPLSPISYDSTEYHLCVPRALTLPRSSPPFPPGLGSETLLWPSSDHTSLPGAEESTGPRGYAPFLDLLGIPRTPDFPAQTALSPPARPAWMLPTSVLLKVTSERTRRSKDGQRRQLERAREDPRLDAYTGVYTEGHWVLAEQDRMGAVRRGRLRARCLRMYSGPGP